MNYRMSFLVEIEVEVSHEKAALAKVSTVIGRQQDINIEAVSNERDNENRAILNFSLWIRNRRHLAQLIRALRPLSVVKRVYRK